MIARLLIVTGLLLTSPSPASATTLYVGTGCPYTSIQSAIDAASSGDDVRVRAGTYRESLTINKVLQLRGGHIACSGTALNGSSVIEPPAAQPNARLIDVLPIATNVLLTGFTLQNALVDGSGAALRIRSGATVTLGNMIFRDNTARGAERGGAIEVGNNAILTASSAFSLLFEHNVASDGGAIYVASSAIVDFATPFGILLDFRRNETVAVSVADGGTSRMRNANFYADPARAASAVRASGATQPTVLELTSGYVRDHQIGAIAATGDNMVTRLTDLTFTANRAASGAALRAGGAVVINNCIFDSNVGSSSAGAVEFSGTSLDIAGSAFRNNQGELGGAVQVGRGEVTLRSSASRDSVFDNNSASQGGAIHFVSNSVGASSLTLNPQTTDIGHVEFINNHATVSGGAINLNRPGALLSINGPAVFVANGAGIGGAIHADTGDWQIQGRAAGPVAFSGNTAVTYGGAIYSRNLGEQDINWNVAAAGAVAFEGNSASNGGGAIFQLAGTLQIRAPTTFLNNQAVNAGASGGHMYTRGIVRMQGQLDGGRGIRMDGARAGADGGAIRVADGYALLAWIELGSDPAKPNVSTFGSGGAIAASGDDTTVVLLNSRIAHNQAREGQGGGAVLVTDSALVNIDAVFAPTPPAALTEGCAPSLMGFDQYCSHLLDNRVNYSGSAVLVSGAALTISHTALTGNGIDSPVGAAGGAIYASMNSTVSGTNLLFANNYKSLRADFSSTMNLDHITVTGDPKAAITVGSTGTVSLHNAILWGNFAETLIAAGGNVSSSGCSLSQSGIAGSIVANPLFVTSAQGSYRLGAGSPALDLCTIGAPDDVVGGMRPTGLRFDAGAFEGVAVPLPDLLFANGFNP